MAEQPTTQLQVSAHRFAVRRIERALLCGDVRPGGVGRSRSALAAGGLLGAIAMAGCALLALVRPQPALGDAPIVVGMQSGALYVRVGQTLHPVLNLASARLIAGAVDPRPVRDTDIGRALRGPMLGIPGAPQALGTPMSDAGTWSVCDTAGAAAATTAVAGPGERGAGLDPEQALPVTSDTGDGAYLLYRGRRMLVDRPAGPAPRRVSALLLNAIPEAPPAALFSGRVAGWPAGSSTLCVNWTRLPDGSAGVTLSAGAGLPLPAGAGPVALAQGDGAGPALDAVYLPPGHSAYVRPAGVSGPSGGARYLIAETGVRFEIGDDDAARSLGLPEAPAPVPWPVLAALPAGPQLSRQQALVAHDVLGPP